jgi:hypothetical protein
MWVEVRLNSADRGAKLTGQKNDDQRALMCLMREDSDKAIFYILRRNNIYMVGMESSWLPGSTWVQLYVYKFNFYLVEIFVVSHF